MKTPEPFILRVPKIDACDSGVVRVSPECYLRLLELKRRTGLPIGRIAEQCIDFALQREIRIEEEPYADTRSTR
ncbi:MAG: hypothetical protein MR295_02290 [Ruminococcus bromii]|nr:hypothetical protein [Ruminococcus bromii]